LPTLGQIVIRNKDVTRKYWGDDISRTLRSKM